MIGIAPRGGAPLVNPPMATVLQNGDRLIVVAEDDSTIRMGSSTAAADESDVVSVPRAAAAPERALILGWNDRTAFTIREMDQYVAPGSEVHVVADEADVEGLRASIGPLQNTAVTIRHGNTTDRRVLDALGADTFNYVLVLCSSHLGVQAADARHELAHVGRHMDIDGDAAFVDDRTSMLCDMPRLSRFTHDDSGRRRGGSGGTRPSVTVSAA